MAVDIVMGLLAASALISVIATVLAVQARDLLKAVIFSALQSVAYTLMYFMLMAPDIVLVYAAVAVGIYPLILILLIKKVGRYEV
ncbi:MAG: DUF4040 domain-containing protein [Crenarchaeota archaeon]|nr:DUF4040 domain-containing protein [Thermoproteota archaeon]